MTVFQVTIENVEDVFWDTVYLNPKPPDPKRCKYTAYWRYLWRTSACVKAFRETLQIRSQRSFINRTTKLTITSPLFVRFCQILHQQEPNSVAK